MDLKDAKSSRSVIWSTHTHIHYKHTCLKMWLLLFLSCDPLWWGRNMCTDVNSVQPWSQHSFDHRSYMLLETPSTISDFNQRQDTDWRRNGQCGGCREGRPFLWVAKLDKSSGVGLANNIKHHCQHSCNQSIVFNDSELDIKIRNRHECKWACKHFIRHAKETHKIPIQSKWPKEWLFPIDLRGSCCSE